jgi:hypothetical protein
MKNKDHLLLNGLEKIVAIKGSLNLGLSAELKPAFPKIVSIQRPLIENKIIPDPN